MITVTAEQAAERIGISPASFRRAVHRGEIPPPSIKSRPYRWSWAAIERALANPEAPATIGHEDDEIMERIRGCAFK